jgi:hypothetical protein
VPGIMAQNGQSVLRPGGVVVSCRVIRAGTSRQRLLLVIILHLAMDRQCRLSWPENGMVPQWPPEYAVGIM